MRKFPAIVNICDFTLSLRATLAFFQQVSEVMLKPLVSDLDVRIALAYDRFDTSSYSPHACPIFHWRPRAFSQRTLS